MSSFRFGFALYRLLFKALNRYLLKNSAQSRRLSAHLIENLLIRHIVDTGYTYLSIAPEADKALTKSSGKRWKPTAIQRETRSRRRLQSSISLPRPRKSFLHPPPKVTIPILPLSPRYIREAYDGEDDRNPCTRDDLGVLVPFLPLPRRIISPFEGTLK